MPNHIFKLSNQAIQIDVRLIPYRIKTAYEPVQVKALVT